MYRNCEHIVVHMISPSVIGFVFVTTQKSSLLVKHGFHNTIRPKLFGLAN